MTGLDHITVRGFRSIASIEELRVGPVSVMIGPNGSGKSNLLGVFSFLNAIGEGRLQEYVIKAGGADKVLHFGSRVTGQIDIFISFGDGRYRYEITVQPGGTDELFPLDETVHVRDEERQYASHAAVYQAMGREARVSEASGGYAGRVRQHMRSWRVYQFHDTGSNSPMRRTADVHDNRYLRADGSNLAAFLYFLCRRHPDSYRTISRTVRQVAPFFEDFELEPQRLNPDKIGLVWRHVGTADYFDASSLSDGTLRFMALATLFLQPAECRPSMILVDEPELGMHPYAVTLLAALMRQASVEAQVIVSTQSSLLLDHFEPDEVIVAERDGGATRLSRLDSSKLSSWLENYSLGQLWEKNELGGRPMPE